ncbi:hypothetical protein M406DRAFT_293581 [Cryphonectria parasitica EP155]|uniref:Major facilitator superfamily (MFS) profile domain-containing protein n=1 Tax=Cryphonectria parasitica (strain ATCC 38755 / EP155) TaxID=660469 RepID=A0A9P4XZS3_CRYP1|nr:uncharacterized protein M406DRAFT_293581 [Cryphonectria parasitica EP155]KAF3763883.1 hypothetical protein M406DRAFT_293581 [Cryphonectria parasitica EP155]
MDQRKPLDKSLPTVVTLLTELGSSSEDDVSEKRETTPRDEADVLASYGLERESNGVISWARGSKHHPRNWPTKRKIYDTALIILLELYTTVISTTGAAVADIAGPEYGMSKLTALFAFTFMYQLGQAIGGYLIPPFSELAGRRYPYLVSSAAFTIFCAVISLGGSSSPATIFVGRFITGFASAVPSVVIAGSVEDLFDTRARVWVVVLWNAATTIALCLGPIYASYIIAAPHAGWRWVYYSASIVTGALTMGLLAVKESRPSVLLGRRVALLAKERIGVVKDLRWNNADSAAGGWRTFAQLVVVRPAHILFTEPLVIMIAFISGISWGIIYLFTESTSGIYQSMGFTKTTASLPFLALACGVFLTFLPRFWDMKVVRRRHQAKEPVEPEDKIMGFAFAAPALAIGLFWFAWTVPPAAPSLPWIVPTLALVPIGFAVNEIAYTLSGLLADSYLLYSASAFSGLAFVRAIISGLMTLVAQPMYKNLSANDAGSILAGVSVLFCLAPWVFLRYSKRLRQASPFAKYSVEMDRATWAQGEA